jgi:CelD/BcsL family acetyltransferase involved in cellulose biosynthesis
MEQFFHARDGELQGLLITLRAGGRMVAGHFGVRDGRAFHPWIAAADPGLSSYSPGHVFLQRAIRAMPDLGLRTYDLSSGHDHYKAQYANTQIAISEGVASAPGAGFDAQAALAGAGRLAGPCGEAVRRAGRRLEQIAAVELTLPGRVMSVLDTLAGASRRSAYLARAAEAHG